MNNVTIKDVAQAANVSIATVSRVLNKNYYVRPELVSKVEAAIRALGYYPNSVARSLKVQSTMTIGYLVSDISNNFFIGVARAVEDCIRSQGLHLLMCSTDQDQQREYDYLKLLIEKKVDGIIINTSGFNDEFIASISEKIPLVLLSRRIMTANVTGDLVESDNIRGTFDLTSYLISLGHRRIAIVNGPMRVSSALERFEGFQRAMARIGTTVTPQGPYAVDGNFTFEGGYRAAKALHELPDQPTAVIFANNEMAGGGLRYYHEHGIDVPGDVSVASYHRIVNDDLLYVHPTYTTMDPTMIGRQLAEFLLDRIQHKDDLRSIANREVRYPAKVVPGNGTRSIL